MHKLPSHLWLSRHGIYYLRIKTGGRDIRRSLNTRDPDMAIIAAWKFGANKIMEKEKGIRGFTLKVNADGSYEGSTNGTPEDNAAFSDALKATLAARDKQQQSAPAADPNALIASLAALTKSAIAAQQPAPVTVKNPTALNDVIRRYIADNPDALRPGTLSEYGAILTRFSRQIGGNTPLHEIDEAAFAAWRTKHLDPMSITRRTYAKKIGAIRNVFAWAGGQSRGMYPTGVNPAHGRTDWTTRELREAASIRRNMFTADHLSKIFQPGILQQPHPDAFLLPWLALWTGARIGELAAIELDNIKRDPIAGYYIHIPGGKTAAATRDIPLHNAVINAGLLDYIADVKLAWPGATRLFPYLSATDKNGYANKPSSRFSDYLQNVAGIAKGQGLVFHSFRHTVISVWQSAGVPEWQRCVVSGHEPSRDAGTNTTVYSHGILPLDRARTEVIDKTDYRGILKWTPPPLKYQPGSAVMFLVKRKGDMERAAIRDERAKQQKRKRY